ncbi:DUF1851 domain-containing protein [bacterium]|nr:DUF1851 domain-containing protein [bacterium]
MADWGRLLIRTNRPDIAEMLGCWEWLIGRDKHPLVMTKFGDWFLADADGQVHWLDVLEGTCKPVAGSVAEFERLMAEEEQLDLWLMLPWCYRLHDEGHVPGEDQCFGFKVPPRLGAPVELANVEVANLMAYQVWMSQIARIPPGTTVDAITVNGRRS